MPITRRSLLAGAVAGGALTGIGALSGCASTGSTGTGSASGAPTAVSGDPLPDASSLQISTSELVPLQLFAWEGFLGEALFALGAASSQTSEVGEVLRIVQTINVATGNPAEPDTGDFDAYCESFSAFGDQLAGLASATADASPVTAKNRFLRASTYATQELFFILGSSAGAREEEVFDKVQGFWNSAVDLMSPKVERFEVSSDFGPIPGYFFAPDESRDPRPTLIISSGSDGQNVESMQFGVTAGLERGFNIVLFEGPGQMTPLFVNSVVFTPDWDQVVGPVLEWAKARPDVGKIGLVGISFGGMLCARAAAKLDGLSAVVLEPAAYDSIALWKDTAAVAQVQQSLNQPAAEQDKVKQQVNQVITDAWPNLGRATQFEIFKRGSIYTKAMQADARADRAPSDYYALLSTMATFNFEDDYRNIKIPTMLTANQGDQFFQDQSVQAFQWLTQVPTGQKQLLELTAAQGAQLHDQPTGPQVAQEYIFDWVTPYLR